MAQSEAHVAPDVSHLRQRVISRNRLSYRVPQTAFWFMAADVLWEVVKENRPKTRSPGAPWWFTVFDLSTAVTAAGIIGSLLIARTQFARTIRPALGFSSNQLPVSALITLPSRWTASVTNGGPGTCTVLRSEWRYALFDEPIEDRWLSWQDAVEALAQRGLDYGRHYYLLHLGPSAVLPGNANHRLEIASFSERAVSMLRTVELRIQVVDLVGDVHERIGNCLYSVHPITGIPLLPATSGQSADS